MNLARLCATLVFAVGTTWEFTGVVGSASGATIYDAAADFSATNNPNGVWSYGQSATLTSAFQIYTQNGPNNENAPPANLLDTWNAGTGGTHQYPSVSHNGTSNSVTFYGSVTFLPGDLSLHPGPNGEYSIVRFTAPASDFYSLDSEFHSLDSYPIGPGEGHTDVHVLLNGVSIFDGAVAGIASPASFSANLLLVAGDQLDFKVGYGLNLNYYSDSTALQAVLTASAPEPGGFLLAALGVVGIVLRSRGLRFRNLRSSTTTPQWRHTHR